MPRIADGLPPPQSGSTGRGIETHSGDILSLQLAVSVLATSEGTLKLSLERVETQRFQAALLRGQGAKIVVDSFSATIMDALVAAIVETGACLAFDAIGGGGPAGQILTALGIAACNHTATGETFLINPGLG